MGSIFYVGGVWYALKDDDFFEFFTQYVPLGDYAVSVVEESEFRKKYQVPHDLGTHEHPAVRSPKTDETKVTISRAGMEARAVKSGLTEDKQNQIKGEEQIVVEKQIHKHDEQQEQQQQQQQQQSEQKMEQVSDVPSKSGSDLNGLPLITISSDLDPVVSKAIISLNKFIGSVNSAKPSEDLVSKISADVNKLSQHIHAMRSAHQEELKKSLESQASKFAALGEARRSEIQNTIESEQEKWAQEFQREQRRLLDLYNSRLLNEIEATKRAVLAYANNKLVAANIESQKRFAEMVAERVEKERDGRLAKIQDLAEAVQRLETLTLLSEDALTETEHATEFQVAVGRVSNIVANSKEPVALRPYLDQIKKALPSDPLVDAALKAFPEDVYDHGVLSPAQLSARFRLLEPELQKASLLPPNAGVAGHIGSWIFSKLLLKKSGNPVGDDIESVLARAETALAEGRVTDAVAEVNSLKGWPKKLAKDWLEEGRKRSEVEFLLNVLQDAGISWAISKK